MQPVSPCAAANGARRWGQGARMLGCRMWGRLAKAQHWAGRCPGRLVVGCWARLWARHLARPCASWLRAKRLETARVRSCLVGSAIARGPVEEWVARRWVAFSLAVACVGCALLARAHMQPHLCVQGRVCVLRPVGVLVVLGCAPRGFPDRFGCRRFVPGRCWVGGVSQTF